ncbi:hypothetical protein GCM10011521_27000 [Arenimonas soli]|uniref:DUF2628 domain-containing protein n=1 Tax=Arenimonas soli TaxID=2269504 RepID=A0ABQ1HTK9_9GAMM|nr:DUF6404 family protein [Arenimonas soli]GGA87174.1 hypothetical protein GCM10011521_27000 [Arenimonas soli]
MNHSEKVEAMQRHLVPLGFSPYTLAPPAWRMMWQAGLQTPPPIFMGFLPLAFGTGLFFAIGWGLLMWVFMWWREGMTVAASAGVALLAGLFFGLAMASYYRYYAKKHRLPDWPNYRGP